MCCAAPSVSAASAMRPASSTRCMGAGAFAFSIMRGGRRQIRHRARAIDTAMHVIAMLATRTGRCRLAYPVDASRAPSIAASARPRSGWGRRRAHLSGGVRGSHSAQSSVAPWMNASVAITMLPANGTKRPRRPALPPRLRIEHAEPAPNLRHCEPEGQAPRGCPTTSSKPLPTGCAAHRSSLDPRATAQICEGAVLR